MQTTRSSFQIPQSSSGSSLVPSNLAALADPPARYVDGPAMDYFVFEAVNTLRASAAVALARTKKLEAEMIEAGLLPPPPPPPQSLNNKEPNPRDSVTSLKSASGKAQPPLDDEEEALRARLEAIGMHVGANFTERCAMIVRQASCCTEGAMMQVMSRQTTVHGNAGRDQVHLQGYLGCILG